jgi:hypothetical protein
VARNLLSNPGGGQHPGHLGIDVAPSRWHELHSWEKSIGK